MRFEFTVNDIDKNYPFSKSHWPGIILLVVLVLSLVLYIIPTKPISSYYCIQLAQWLQLGVILILAHKSIQAPSIGFVVIFYIISRVILFSSAPLLEDDYYRYLWDGHILSKGLNPYSFPPDHSFWDQIPSIWRDQINFPHVGTIYPPIAQSYFAVIYSFFGESILGLRIGAVALEIICGLLILKIINNENLNLKPLIIFLFFPTLMKENINSVHFDMLATTLFFASFIYFKNSNPTYFKKMIAWLFFSASVLVKVFPVIFLPILFYESKKKLYGLFIFLIFFMLCYLPFLDAGFRIFGGTKAFAQDWLFFESLAAYVQIFFTSLLNLNFIENSKIISIIATGGMTRMALGLVVLISSLYLSFYSKILLERKIIILFLILFSVTTVMNSWYWLWLLPFLILYAPLFTWIFPIFTTLGYSWFVDEELYHRIHYPIYGVFILSTALYLLFQKKSGLEKWKRSE